MSNLHLLTKVLAILLFISNLAFAQLEIAWLISPELYHQVHALKVDQHGRILVSPGLDLYAFSNDGHLMRRYTAWGIYVELVEPGLMLTDINNSTSALMNVRSGQVIWTYEPDLGTSRLKQHVTTGFFGASTFQLLSNDTRIVYLNNQGQEIWEVLNVEEGNQFISGFVPVLPNHLLTFTTQNTIDSLFTIDKYDTTGAIVNSIVYDDGVSLNTSTYIRDIYTEPSGTLFLFGNIGTSPDGGYSAARMTLDGTILDYLIEYDPEDIEIVQEHMAPANDGGYYRVQTVNDPDTTFYLYRYNASMQLLWSDSYYHPDQENAPSGGLYVATTLDGGPVVTTGYGYVPGGNEDPIYSIFVVKFEAVPTDLMIKIQPHNDSYHFIPPCLLRYGARLSNTTNADIITDVWIIARGPNGYPSQPFRMWEDVTVPANGSIEGVLRQWVPEGVAAGPYNYIVRVGDFPNPAVQDYFSFRVINGPEPDLDPPRERGVVAPFLPAPEWETQPAELTD